MGWDEMDWHGIGDAMGWRVNLKNTGREIFEGPKGWSCTNVMKINETCIYESLWCLWKIFHREVKLHAREKSKARNRAWEF